MKFSERLKHLRIDRNLTQKELALYFKVHQTTVKDWETRGKQPNYDTLVDLARFFNVTTDYILGLEE